VAVPGWVESQSAPKAQAVVSALKTTARIRLDFNIAVSPRRQAITKIDVEGHANAEQQRQGDDVGEVERQVEGSAGREGQQAAQQDRQDGQHHVAEPAQHHRQEQDNGDEGIESCLQESVDDAVARGLRIDRCAGRIGRNPLHGGRKASQEVVVVPAFGGRHLNAGAPILGHPIGDQIARQGLLRHRDGFQLLAHLVENRLQGTGHYGSGLGPDIGRCRLEPIERLCQSAHRCRCRPLLRLGDDLPQCRGRALETLPQFLVRGGRVARIFIKGRAE
jgi:hypothetical protein